MPDRFRAKAALQDTDDFGGGGSLGLVDEEDAPGVQASPPSSLPSPPEGTASAGVSAVVA